MHSAFKLSASIVVAIPFSALLFTACGAEAPQPSGSAAPVGAAEEDDSHTDCLAGCSTYGVGTDKRFSCCSHCILGITYDSGGDPRGKGWVCSTETQAFVACTGQNNSGIKDVCAQDSGCGPGFSQVSAGNYKAGTYCFNGSHAYNFACYDCNGDGDCQTADDQFDAKNTSAHQCPNATPLCNSSGGDGDKSHYVNCNYLHPTTCCAPDQLVPAATTTSTTTPLAVDLGAVAATDATASCGCLATADETAPQ